MITQLWLILKHYYMYQNDTILTWFKIIWPLPTLQIRIPLLSRNESFGIGVKKLLQYSVISFGKQLIWQQIISTSTTGPECVFMIASSRSSAKLPLRDFKIHTNIHHGNILLTKFKVIVGRGGVEASKPSEGRMLIDIITKKEIVSLFE